MSSSRKKTFFTSEKKREICFIIHPVYSMQILAKEDNQRSHSQKRSNDEAIEEISSLTQAIDLEISNIITCKIQKIDAGKYFSKGARENVKTLAEEYEPHVIIVNAELSPVQQRNLENQWQTKVIDRTGLILEIFGARAQTKEGRLQVELAALDYQKSRLVRSWTHLERQRGGAGFMGGPGETQIEIDRRLIGERITTLKTSLERVRKTRHLARQNRKKTPAPVVALVGYTNAGKSTLFNALTKSNVFAKDLLFATLDPTLRHVDLPNGQRIILSDTVGFISDLPTHLIAAFRATLEETVHADVILHVIDGSRSDSDAQRQDVIEILEDLGIEYHDDERIIEVFNKMDTMSDRQLDDTLREQSFSAQSCGISALKKQGFESLTEIISNILTRERVYVTIDLAYKEGKALSWLYENAEILEKTDHQNHMSLSAHIDEPKLMKFQSTFPQIDWKIQKTK